jgi:uncharacterized protein (TIRG00374 family)
MKLGLQLVFTVALVALIVWYLGGIHDLAAIVATVDPIYVFWAFLVGTLDRALMTFKWGLLLRARGVSIGFFRGMKIYCASMIWGLFLPMTVGADAIRAVMASRSGMPSNVVVASIVIERVVGFLASLISGLIGLYILTFVVDLHQNFESAWWILGGALLVGSVIFGISLSKRLFDAIHGRLSPRVRSNRLVMRLTGLHETYVGYSVSRTVLWTFFGLTLLEQGTSIVFAWVIALGLHLKISLLLMAGVMPVSMLVMRLPISFNGIGVFEGAFIFLMSFAGVGAPEAVSIAVIGRLIEPLVWTPWWIRYTLETKSLRPPKEELSGAGV